MKYWTILISDAEMPKTDPHVGYFQTTGLHGAEFSHGIYEVDRFRDHFKDRLEYCIVLYCTVLHLRMLAMPRYLVLYTCEIFLG